MYGIRSSRLVGVPVCIDRRQAKRYQPVNDKPFSYTQAPSSTFPESPNRQSHNRDGAEVHSYGGSNPSIASTSSPMTLFPFSAIGLESPNTEGSIPAKLRSTNSSPNFNRRILMIGVTQEHSPDHQCNVEHVTGNVSTGLLPAPSPAFTKPSTSENLCWSGDYWSSRRCVCWRKHYRISAWNRREHTSLSCPNAVKSRERKMALIGHNQITVRQAIGIRMGVPSRRRPKICNNHYDHEGQLE